MSRHKMARVVSETGMTPELAAAVISWHEHHLAGIERARQQLKEAVRLSNLPAFRRNLEYYDNAASCLRYVISFLKRIRDGNPSGRKGIGNGPVRHAGQRQQPVRSKAD